MTKREIVKRIADTVDVPQLTVIAVVQMLLEEITDVLVQKGNIELRNFGVFTVKKRKARKARNPRTGESVMVPARKSVTFKPGLELMKRLAEVEAGIDQGGKR